MVPARIRKVSEWRPIKISGVSTAAKNIEANPSDNPWEEGRWSFNPGKISLFSASKKRVRALTGHISASEDLMYRTRLSRSPRSKFIKIGISLFIAIDLFLVCFLITTL